MINTTVRYHLGLVVGKFSPLHFGHEFVIDHAFALCDQVLVLGYSQPAFDGCGREQRQAWVERRFPNAINLQIDDTWVRERCVQLGIGFRPIPDNAALDAEQQAWLAWLLSEVLDQRPDAMIASEPYVFSTCALLSSHWRKSVMPIFLDPLRQNYPISATVIRRDLRRQNAWMHPDVARDFVQRVALLGAESSGKSTLAQALAKEFNTLWVPEYGRELWVEKNGELTLQDLIDIARTQTEREEIMMSRASGLLFCDTSALTTLGYAGWMFEKQPPELQALAARRYDLLVLTDTDFGFVQDGTRQSAVFRKRQHDWYLAQLQQRAEPALHVRGSVADRVRQVRITIESLNSPIS